MDLQNGSLRGGGRASHFFHLFSSLGPLWASLGQNGAKGLIMTPFFSHVGSDLSQKYLKMCPPVGKKVKHLSKFFLQICEHFVLFFVIFELILCAEYSSRGMEAQGGIGRPRRVFEIWWVCRPIFHFIL